MKNPKFTKVINLSNNISHICRESNKRLDKLLNKQKALAKGKKVADVNCYGNRVWPRSYTQRMG